MEAVETKRKPGRPATGQMPKRYFRMDDEAWQQIADAAGANGETISKYIRRVLLRDAKRVLKQK